MGIQSRSFSLEFFATEFSQLPLSLYLFHGISQLCLESEFPRVQPQPRKHFAISRHVYMVTGGDDDCIFCRHQRQPGGMIALSYQPCSELLNRIPWETKSSQSIPAVVSTDHPRTS